MRNLLISILASLLVVGVLGANPTDRRSDIEKPVPLAKAVEEFNQKYPDNNPLTEAEVIAAVRQIRRKHPTIPDEIFELYQKVAEERMLLPGFYFSRMTRLTDGEWQYEVDWKDLRFEVLPQHKFPPELKLKGFNYRIRARFISSKPRPAQEAVKQTGFLQPVDLMKLRLELEEARKKFLRQIPTEPQGDFWHPDELQRFREQAVPARRG